MNRNEFLNTLDKSLGNMSQSDRIDILYDYKEHFNIGLEQGKSEEEICMTLGDPRMIAKQYRVDFIVKRADENKSAANILRAIYAALSLGLFNLLIMLPVFACLVAALVSLYAAAIGVTLGGVGVFLTTILQPVLPNFFNIPDINKGILIFGSVGVTSMGLLITVGSAYITKFFYIITMKYIKTNIKIISK